MITGRWEAPGTATSHRSPPRGPPPRQVPAFRPLAIPYRGPGALAGGPEGAHGRDARTAISFRRRYSRLPKKIECIRDATLRAPKGA